jgi:hypothetical protein
MITSNGSYAIISALSQPSEIAKNIGDFLVQHAVLLDVVSGMIFLVSREFAGKIRQNMVEPTFRAACKAAVIHMFDTEIP